MSFHSFFSRFAAERRPSLSMEGPDAKIRLGYLDGLRGLAALYVVLFHCLSEFTWRGDSGGLSPWLLHITAWMNFGHYAVVVFIVLSGYCLMLPVVRAPNLLLPGGILAYLKRRAARTLPAYYGAVALSLILIACVPGLRQIVGAQWDRCLPAFAPDVLLSHLLLLHNLRFEWHQTIDAPLWSMATEWDIYLAFAFVLLPLWRKLGTVSAVGLASIIGLLPHLLLPPGENFDWACPWFLGAFALGMAGAAIGFSQASREGGWRTSVPWKWLTLLFGAATAMVSFINPRWGGTHWADMDFLVGTATACFLIWIGRRPAGVSSLSRTLILGVLEHRRVVSLGAFSYSLYLIHFPLLALIHIPLRRTSLAPDWQFALLVGLAVPISLAAAFLFSHLLERPFLRHRFRAVSSPFSDKARLVLLVCLAGVSLLTAGVSTLLNRTIFWNPLLYHNADVWEYYRASYLVTHGLLPYRDFSLEYPPLSLVAFLLPLAPVLGHTVNFPDYVRLLLGTNTVLCVVMALMLARTPLFPADTSGRRVERLTGFVVMVVILSPLLPWRYDLFPALLTLLAFHAVLGRRPGMAGLWLGFGIAAKLYPAVLIPVLIAFYWVNEDRSALKRLGVGCAGALTASLLPFAAAGAKMLSVLQYHQQRGLEVESLPAGLLMLAHRLAGVKFGVIFNYGAFHLLSPSASAILRVLPLVFGTMFLVVLAAAVRRFRADKSRLGAVAPDSLVLALSAMLLTFIVCNKVFSPQYMIWLLPFAALMRPRSAAVFAGLCALTIWLFPFAFISLLRLDWPAVLVLNLRNLGAVLLLGAWVRECVVSVSAKHGALPIIKAKAA